MPIDPTIPLGVRPPAPIDVAGIREQQLRLRALYQEEAARQLQLEQAQRAEAEQTAFHAALQSGADDEQLLRTSPKLAGPYLKGRTEIQTAGYDAQKKKLDLAAQHAALFGQIAGSVVDAPSFTRAMRTAAGMGLIPPEQASEALQTGWNQETSDWLKQAIAQSQTVKDQIAEAQRQIEERRKAETHQATLPGVVADTQAKQMAAAGQAVSGVSNQAEYDAWRESLPEELRRRTPAMYSPAAVAIAARRGMRPSEVAAAEARTAGQEETARHNAAMEASTIRGQNMADSRGRAALTFRQEHPPPSSAERRVYGFYTRAADASEVLEKQQEAMVRKGLLGQAWQQWAPNFLQSEENQVYEQAQRQFTEARMRKDSGAVVPPFEYANDKKTFFPQPGDGPKVIKRKADARRAMLASLLRESGRAGEVAAGAPVADPFAALGFEEDK